MARRRAYRGDADLLSKRCRPHQQEGAAHLQPVRQRVRIAAARITRPGLPRCPAGWLHCELEVAVVRTVKGPEAQAVRSLLRNAA